MAWYAALARLGSEVEMRTWLLACFGAILLRPCTVLAADYATLPPQRVGDTVEVAPESPRPFIPTLEAPSDIGVGVQAYSGFGAQFRSGSNDSSGFVGAFLRTRLHYFELAATYEVTGPVFSGIGPFDGRRDVGGFAGAFLPFDRWVDFDAAFGVSARTYWEGTQKYATIPAITLRLGVSDRMAQALVAGRFGAALAFSAELNDEIRSNLGYPRKVGGVSVGLFVDIGFEVGGRASR